MGQGGSKVVVHVQLDGAYYYAGDTVTGAVVVHTQQPISVKDVSVKVRAGLKGVCCPSLCNIQKARTGLLSDPPALLQ